MGVLWGCKCGLLSFSELLDRRSCWVGAAWMVGGWGAAVYLSICPSYCCLCCSNLPPPTQTHTHTRAHTHTHSRTTCFWPHTPSSRVLTHANFSSERIKVPALVGPSWCTEDHRHESLAGSCIIPALLSWKLRHSLITSLRSRLQEHT